MPTLWDAKTLAGALTSLGIPSLTEERGVVVYPTYLGSLSVSLVRVPIHHVATALEVRSLAERGKLTL